MACTEATWVVVREPFIELITGRTGERLTSLKDAVGNFALTIMGMS